MPKLEKLRKPGAQAQKINRAPSPALAIALPWLLVMLGSLSPMVPYIGSGPFVPPLGFMMLLAWLQMRPGLFPVWAGLPLGLFDDLYSGQPLGSAMLLWSAVLILLDTVEARFPWRGFLQNWIMAAILIAAYLVLAALIATGIDGVRHVLIQAGLAAATYPLVGRLVGLADRTRLVAFRVIG